jgi:hypothetical protein
VGAKIESRLFEMAVVREVDGASGPSEGDRGDALTSSVHDVRSSYSALIALSARSTAGSLVKRRRRKKVKISDRKRELASRERRDERSRRLGFASTRSSNVLLVPAGMATVLDERRQDANER